MTDVYVVIKILNVFSWTVYGSVYIALSVRIRLIENSIIFISIFYRQKRQSCRQNEKTLATQKTKYYTNMLVTIETIFTRVSNTVFSLIMESVRQAHQIRSIIWEREGQRWAYNFANIPNSTIWHDWIKSFGGIPCSEDPKHFILFISLLRTYPQSWYSKILYECISLNVVWINHWKFDEIPT